LYLVVAGRLADPARVTIANQQRFSGVDCVDRNDQNALASNGDLAWNRNY
jgi:hypothetical protein